MARNVETNTFPGGYQTTTTTGSEKAVNVHTESERSDVREDQFHFTEFSDSSDLHVNTNPGNTALQQDASRSHTDLLLDGRGEVLIGKGDDASASIRQTTNDHHTQTMQEFESVHTDYFPGGTRTHESSFRTVTASNQNGSNAIVIDQLDPGQPVHLNTHQDPFI